MTNGKQTCLYSLGNLELLAFKSCVRLLSHRKMTWVEFSLHNIELFLLKVFYAFWVILLQNNYKNLAWQIHLDSLSCQGLYATAVLVAQGYNTCSWRPSPLDKFAPGSPSSYQSLDACDSFPNKCPPEARGIQVYPNHGWNISSWWHHKEGTRWNPY